MDRSTIFSKTAKGVEEAETRKYKINMRQRAALLMVNGVDTVETMIKKFHGLEEISGFLGELAAHGFVVEVAPPAAGVGQVVRTIVSRVHELLGPDGDAVAERLEELGETAKTLAPILQFLEQRREMFDSIAGKQKSAGFFDQLRKLEETRRPAG
jgi:hypothetical protein